MSPENESLLALSRRLAEATDGTPEREALLQRLAERIRSGEYEVDAEALASSLLDELAPRDLSEEDPQK